MSTFETGFSETSAARRAVEEDRKKARTYLLAEWDRIWVKENRPVTVVDLNRMAQDIEEGKHAK